MEEELLVQKLTDLFLQSASLPPLCRNGDLPEGIHLVKIKYAIAPREAEQGAMQTMDQSMYPVAFHITRITEIGKDMSTQHC